MTDSPCSSANSLNELQGTFSASDSILQMPTAFQLFTLSGCPNFPAHLLAPLVPFSARHIVLIHLFIITVRWTRLSFWVLSRGWWAQLQIYKPTNGLEQVSEWQIQSHESTWHKLVVRISSAIPMTSHRHTEHNTLIIGFWFSKSNLQMTGKQNSKELGKKKHGHSGMGDPSAHVSLSHSGFIYIYIYVCVNKTLRHSMHLFLLCFNPDLKPQFQSPARPAA